MTRSSPSRVARRKLGAPKKDFRTDRDRGTIAVAELLHRIGFNSEEAFDLAAAVREGKLEEATSSHKRVTLGFRLPRTVDGRVATLRQKSKRESTAADTLRRDVLAARVIIADRARNEEEATRALDHLLALTAVGGIEKLHRAVAALTTRRKRRRSVAQKAH